MNFEGRVAVVTGGGTGLGKEVSRLLVEHGAELAIVYSRSKEEAETTAGELAREERRITVHRVDVSEEAGVAAGFDEIARAHGGIDLLVNNAGTTEHVPFPELDALPGPVWDKILGVNVTSTSAYRPSGSSIAYAVSKAAEAHLTRCLALALAPEVRVNAVAPGLVDTPWTADWDDVRAGVAAIAPLRRSGQPDDVAEVVLAAVRAKYATGQVWAVDGGVGLR